jgi:hypothetical protein
MLLTVPGYALTNSMLHMGKEKKKIFQRWASFFSAVGDQLHS